jgi:hypothetical protein
VKLPDDLCSTWDTFVRDWCAGIPPAEGQADTVNALESVRRLWPEYVSEMERHPFPTIFLVETAVRRGGIIARTEHLQGFAAIVKRLRAGELPAFAELETADAIGRLGLHVELEPNLRGRVPDLAVRIGEDTIFIEVIAPRAAVAVLDAEKALYEIAARLVEQTAGTYSEVAVLAEPEQVIDRVVEYAASVAPDNAVHERSGLARVRRMHVRPGDHVDQTPTLRTRPAGPLLVAGAARFSDAELCIASAHTAFSDERAHRLLAAELKHFPRDTTNVIVVSLDSGQGDMREWSGLTQRWFQPDRNRRISAVILHSTSFYVNPPRQLEYWSILENPHGYVTVPAAFVSAIEHLDKTELE